MGDHPRGERRFAVDAVVPQDNRMLGAEAVLPHFWTHDVARQTRWRVSLLVPPTRILTVVNRAHESLYSPLLKGTPRITSSCSLKIRGTAAAIVYALRRLSELNPCASVVTDARGATLWANWIRRSEINENATLFPAGQRSTEQKSDPLAGKECRHDPPP